MKIVCSSCHALGADRYSHLCNTCYEYYETHIKFYGEIPENKRQDVLAQMFCNSAFTPADCAHGVILINGVPRFLRCELTRKLATPDADYLLRGDFYSQRLYYRNLGYSLDDYQQLFSPSPNV